MPKNATLLKVKEYASTLLEIAKHPPLNTQVAPPDLGISDYIEWYLGTVEKATAKQIGEAWAAYVNEEYENVKTAISNALNRLKNELEKIDSEAIGAGRKDGYYWFKL